MTCATDPSVLARRLLASPCLQRGRHRLLALFNARSAAEALDAALAQAPRGAWVVWVHQDVHLPAAGTPASSPACRQRGTGPDAGRRWRLRRRRRRRLGTRAGRVLDRGQALEEPAPLPCRVDSLDELLVAVRADAGLRFDPALAFDFYGTDIVLLAQARGLGAAVVDAWCEHWSNTPRAGGLPAALADAHRRQRPRLRGQVGPSAAAGHALARVPAAG